MWVAGFAAPGNGGGRRERRGEGGGEALHRRQGLLGHQGQGAGGDGRGHHPLAPVQRRSGDRRSLGLAVVRRRVPLPLHRPLLPGARGRVGPMRLKQRPEDFQVAESFRFDPAPRGEWFVYLMDKQKLSTFEAVERICARARLRPADVSYCGLKDKQGRTTQLVAVRGRPVEIQEPDLRLKPLGRTAGPLSAANTTSNRFAVAFRDLSEEDLAHLLTSLAEVCRLGVVNYFDSQRFGALKHGQEIGRASC